MNLKRKVYHLWLIIAVLLSSNVAANAAEPILTDFYTYTEVENSNGVVSYVVALSTNFRTQLNKASGGKLTSNGYTWKTGSALPNPAPDGKYNGKDVTDMNFLFTKCDVLTSLDLSNFDTSNVTNMDHMIFGCSKLTSITFGDNFKTSKVTTLKSMFSGCSVLKKLDLSSFDTSNVTTMETMFYGCNALEALNLSSFKTPNVTTMRRMFYYCKVLTSLDLSSFNTLNVATMESMFFNCIALTSIKLGDNFKSSKVTDMSYMFKGCSVLGDLVLDNFSTSVCNNMTSMFEDCSNITRLDLKNFDILAADKVSKRESLTWTDMFKNCGKNVEYYGPAKGWILSNAAAKLINASSEETGINKENLWFDEDVNPATGVESTKVADCTVYGTTGNIIVNAEQGTSVTVYDLSGRTLLDSTVEGETTVNATAGVYVVKTTTTTTKVIVK